MKHKRRKKLALLLVLLLLVQMIQPIGLVSSKAAAAPKLNKSKITLNNVGDTYTLVVKNKRSGSTYKWSSSDKKVATVNKYGVVKSVKGGTATIRCKITLKNKKTKTLTCAVTVRIPATAVSISNKKLTTNNCQTIKVGEQYDFNRKLTPSTSTDSTYWEVEDTSIATVDSNGVVTAKKQGLTRLIARTGTSKSNAKSGIINDALNLYVIGSTAEVISVNQASATVMQIAFSEPINPDTVFNIEDSTTLLDNISFLALRDDYGKQANAYGKITGTFSTDYTLLTLKSESPFKGKYEITIKNLGTKSKKLVDKYERTMDLGDTVAPKYVDTTVDETGLIASINFSEPINNSAMTIETVTRADGVTMNALSTAVLKNKSIYTLSSDKTSLIVNMVNINVNDKNKLIYVLVKGIEDLAGNKTDTESISMQVFSDTSTKAQANLLNIERTSYYTITATFDKAIQTTGTLYIKGVSCNGVIDPKNKKVVKYTIPASVATLTGSQSVNLIGFSGYNVATSTPTTNVTRTINFTITAMADAPQLVDYTTDMKLNMITLNYSEKVHLELSSGKLAASVTQTFEGTSYTYTYSTTIPYQAVVEDNVVKVILDAEYLQQTGTYLVTIPAAFVTDEDDIPNNKVETIAIIKTEASTTPSSNPLPAPISVVQSANDNSVVNVIFENKLDVTSATKASNYSFNNGVVVESATLTQNDKTKAVVQLRLGLATVVNSEEYQLTISNVSGYAGSYGSIDPNPIKVTLRENNPPTLISPVLTSNTTIVLTFTEPVQGSVSCTVTQNGNLLSQSGSPVVSGSYVTISLSESVSGSSGIYLLINGNLVDAAGNTAIISDGSIAVR
ncbi:Ig-like domain-containing protein [Anaerosporobacter faecicola]|uniref:Ig-like domain-containing protein n=1 Tax=Anaerosporobacter faecicola TaxID=2718714 RepID=UPI0014390668|nr:Ig-like domain-containing protein [Anaerosporobacter faecicola]